MSRPLAFQLVEILALGVLAQVIAARFRVPSILILLVTGIVAGPLTGELQPDALFGHLLMPMVTLAVGVILYEGGLNLKFRELREVGGTFLLLTTVGVLISWVTVALAGHYLLGFPRPVAILLSAILVVTGPTVVGPILRHLRLRGKVSSLLKWEGIAIDPLGAVLAVLSFGFVAAGGGEKGLSVVAWHLGLTLAVGLIAGCLAAAVLIVSLSRYWIPDTLHNPVSLAVMFVTFTICNLVQEESNLLAVTVMGICLANQRWVSIRHVVEFKETLTTLLISCLFIVLAARLKLTDLQLLDWHSFAYVAVLFLVARPLSVLASTWRSSLTWQERCFLCCMAPRGIVAVSISTVFSLSLVEAGYARAVEIVPITFLVVFCTVLVYGLAAAPLAAWLGLSKTNPQGILFVGANAWVRALAKTLKTEGFDVFLVDTEGENVRACRMAGLPAVHGSVLAEQVREEIDFSGLGRLLAVTSNNEVNSLACLRYIEDFGRQEVYQLRFSRPLSSKHEAVSLEHRGRLLFQPEQTYSALEDFAGDNPRLKVTKLTQAFDYAAYVTEHGDQVWPLFVIAKNDQLRILSDEMPTLSAGDRLVSLVCGTPQHAVPAAQL